MFRTDRVLSMFPCYLPCHCKDSLRAWSKGSTGTRVWLIFPYNAEEFCSNERERCALRSQWCCCASLAQNSQQKVFGPDIVMMKRERFFFCQVKDPLSLLRVNRYRFIR